jgi:hypothetical protein
LSVRTFDIALLEAQGLQPLGFLRHNIRNCGAGLRSALSRPQAEACTTGRLASIAGRRLTAIKGGLHGNGTDENG